MKKILLSALAVASFGFVSRADICPSTLSQPGTDTPGMTAEVTDFSCVGAETIVGATLDFDIEDDWGNNNCGAPGFNYYIVDLYVNGNLEQAGICSQTGLDLTGYLPLTSVELRVVDDAINDGFADDLTVNMTVNLEFFPACPSPTGFTLLSADNTSANFTWTDPTGIPEWQLEYGTVGFTPGTGLGTQSIEVTNAPTIGGLTTNSFYDVYMRAICNPGVDTSIWIGPISFNTYNQGQFMTSDNDCGPGFNDITSTGTMYSLGDDGTQDISIPFNFLFQGSILSDLTLGSNGATVVGAGQAVGFTNGTMAGAADGFYPFWDDMGPETLPGDGVYIETIGTAPNQQFIMQWNKPQLGDPGTYVFQVVLDEATNEIYYLYDVLELGNAINDYGAGATVGIAGPNSDLELSFNDATYLTNNSCIHFYYTNCPPPSNLMVTDFDNDTIVVTWNEIGNATNWNVNFGDTGFDPETEGTTSSRDQMNDTLDVLNQLTSYDIYVQSDCGGETSGWFGPINQTTLPNCADPSLLPLGYLAEDTIEVSFVDNAGALNWNFQYGEAGFEIGSGETMSTMTTTDSIIDASLMGSVVYDVYVQADCLTPGDTSNWVGPMVVAMPIANDSTCDAIAIAVDGSVNMFNNTGATPQINENLIEPITNGFTTQDGWGQSGTDLSTWFTFVAPASEIVEITTKDENYDGQIAVYEVTDCSDLSTFTLLGANDDGYGTLPGGGSELTVCGLTAGNTYYLLHDDYAGTGEGNYSISITEVAVPEAGTVDSMTICAGDGVDMNAQLVGAEEGGVWTFVPTQDGSFITDDTTFVLSGLLALDTYSFQYTVNKRCAMDSVVLAITSVGPSSAGEVTATLDACFHTAVNLFDGLSGSVDLGGVWYNQLDEAQPNNTIASNTIDVPGAYNFTYIVANEACPADTAEITVVYQDCLGLDEDQIGDINVYPNPSNGVINIANNGNTSEFSVTIQDVRGKVVYTNTPNLATGSVESIDLTSNNKGIYFVTLTSEGATNQYKVVLQ